MRYVPEITPRKLKMLKLSGGEIVRRISREKIQRAFSSLFGKSHRIVRTASSTGFLPMPTEDKEYAQRLRDHMRRRALRRLLRANHPDAAAS